jgi:hypothetical protein
LEIAKATNSQKAIKPADLKANSPEQVRFSQSMRAAGVFYQTKRGEAVPPQYKLAYLNSDLSEIGKLCLSGIFQLPGTSRNKPSTLYNPQYYDIIFNSNQMQVAKLCKELLYIDYYFRNAFLKRFDAEHKNLPGVADKISFAHNARTICLSFVTLASRYHQGALENSVLQDIFNASRSDNFSSQIYDGLKDLSGWNNILPANIFEDKNKYDEVLYKLFMLIINAGSSYYSMAMELVEGLNATNYLKKDKNYYIILKSQWASNLQAGVKQIFESL